jgi:hypothetical protein
VKNPTTSREPTSSTTKLPSDLLKEQRFTYGELVRAREIAGSRTATEQEKIYASMLQQRRDRRVRELRASIRLVG